MSRTIHSGPLTFIDLTDTKKVDVHIASNLPTIQIFNSNNNTCSPDWSSTPLTLTLTAYADSTNVTSNLTSINWLRQVGTADPVVIQDSGATLPIATNELIDENIAMESGVVAYICQIQYNNNTFENKITFARTDTGLNGSDGTSITIKGVAYCDTTLTDDDIGNEVSLKDEDNYSITAEEDGDSYVVQGYLCSYISDNESFVCVGKLQGQKGEDAKNIILTGTSQVFKVDENDDISPATITVVATKINFTGDLTWSYRCDGDAEFTTTPPNGVVRENDRVTIAGGSLDNNVSAITIKATHGPLEDIFTVYKSIDGKTGDKGEDAAIAFLTNENTSFHANSNGVVQSSTIFQTNVVAYNGTTKVMPVLGEIIDLPEGISVVPNKGTAYADGELSETIATIYTDATLSTEVDAESLTDGDSFIICDYLYKYDEENACFKTEVVTFDDDAENGEIVSVSEFNRIVTDNEVTLLFTVSQNSNPPSNDVITVPVIAPVSTNLLLSYSKINAGAKGEDGISISGVSVKYGVTSTISASPEIDVEWVDVLPDTVNDGDYLWTRTQIDYTDTSKEDTVTYTYAKQGSQGESGSSISIVAISYCAHDSSTTPPETSWSDTIVETTVDKQYLWTKTEFSDGEVAYSVARQGFAGQDGQTSYLHIKYADVDNPTSEQMKDAGGIYLGQYTDFNPTDSTDPDSYTWTRIKGDQGVQGPKGDNGQQYYTWIKYADDSSGTNMSNDPDGKAYIGLAYNKTTATESTDYNDYTWSLIKGETGPAGPKGDNGEQYYTWIKYADDSSGANMSDSPNGKLYIGLAYNKTTSTESSTASDYTWALFKGDKGDKGNTGDKGAGINSVTVTYGVSDSASTQPTNWDTTIPTVAEGDYLWTRTITDYTDASIEDTETLIYAKQGYKGDTGSAGTSVTVSKIEYQEGESATSAPNGSWSNSVVSAAEGKYLWTKTTFSDGKTAYGVAKQGSKGAKGDTGNDGADAYTIILTNESHIFAGNISSAIEGSTTTQIMAYKGSTAQSVTINSVNGQTASTSKTATGITGLSFQCSATSGASPTITFTCDTSFASANGTIPIVLTVGGIQFTKQFTYSIAFKGATGAQGDTGVGIKSVTEHYLATSASSDVTSSTTGWTDAIQTIDANKKYLWNYETITYTNNTTSTTTPVIIGTFGNTGKGIKTVTEYYLATSTSSGVTTTTSGWETTMQPLTTTNKYLWNYEVITYTDNSTSTVSPVIIGVYGDKGIQGDKGTGVSSVTVTYGTSTTASTKPTSWQTTIPTVAEGSYLWTRTITDYTDSSVADTETYTYAKQGKTPVKGTDYHDGTSVTVSSIQYQSGSSATDAPTGIWSTSVVTVAEGSYLWTKTTFSDNTVAYGVAKQGKSGSSASLVDITPSAHYFKSTTGKDGTFTPEYIYLYPRFQTVTFSKWQYSVNGGTTWFDASGANGLSVSTYSSIANTLRVARTSTLYTDAVTSISFRCVSSNASVYDTVTIAKIYDVVDLDLGVTFQLYAPKGYLITNETPEITLQAFAYEGSQEITNATFKWSVWNGETWSKITNATNSSLTVNKTDVMKTSVYKCEMTYNGEVYESTATVEDKTDVYESLIRVVAQRTLNNGMYWILSSIVYSEEGEKDALLGPVSEIAPTNPTAGSYWYQINQEDYSITLKKYSGKEWVVSTDKQELLYDWLLFKDQTDMLSLGDKSKVKIVKSGDFVTTCNIQCNIFSADNTVLSRNNQVLNDPTDPIVSETAPTNPIDGQIWIKIGSNNNYTLSVWNTELNKWILSSADTQNKVYVTKPSQYNIGDLWIVDSNYSPTAYENGVMKDYKHPEKTMLKAVATSQTYSDAHWTEALKYQKELDGVVGDMEKFKQFISIDDTGLTMQAKGSNNTISDFKTMLTNTELGFYQGSTKVAYINNNQLNISKADITNGLTVSGTTPTFKIGNFTFIQESNGSLSIG